MKDDFEIAMNAGLWFFQKNILNNNSNFQNEAISPDSKVQKKLIKKITKKLNGGDNDLVKRTNLLEESKTKVKCN